MTNDIFGIIFIASWSILAIIMGGFVLIFTDLYINYHLRFFKSKMAEILMGWYLGKKTRYCLDVIAPGLVNTFVYKVFAKMIGLTFVLIGFNLITELIRELF